MEAEFTFGIGLILGGLLISVVGIASSVLLGFCVYYDALYRRNENPVMWGVLSGFFEIAALVYLILQMSKKSQPMRCMQCGTFLVPGAQFCTRCGRPLMVPSPEQMAMYDKRRRLLLWLWIASMALLVIMGIVIGIVFVASVMQMPYIY